MKWLLAGYAATRLAFFAAFPHCAEDAFITFRAARTFLWTLRPTFNPHEASWPASSPLWVAYSALGLLTHVSIELWAQLGSLTAECFLIAAVWRMIGSRGAVCFAILLAGFQVAIAISLSGIEMYAMCAAFAWALLGNRWAMGLLILSRPEGVILGGGAAIKAGRRALVPAIVGLSGWALMALLCGTWLPAGITAKAGSYGLHWFHGAYWLRLFWPSAGNAEQHSLGVIGLVALLLAPRAWQYVPASEGAPRRFMPLLPNSLILALSGLGLLLAYFVTGTTYFVWYLALPIVACMLVIASTLSTWRWGYIAAALIAACSWTTTYPIIRWGVQYQSFSRVAAVLPDSGTVVMDAVGVIGWQKPGVRFLDMIGLVSPEVERERRKGDGWLGRILVKERPDAMVLYETEADTGVPRVGAHRMFSPNQEIPPYRRHASVSNGMIVFTKVE